MFMRSENSTAANTPRKASALFFGLMTALVFTLSVQMTPARADKGDNADKEDGDNVTEPVHDRSGNTDQKIRHRMNPETYMQSPFGKGKQITFKAPSAGTVAAIGPAISYHGGPIMSSVSKIVVIWYGNWNQGNGTDTPAGQQIIRDALYGMSLNYGTNNYTGITTGYQSSLGQYTQKKPTLAVTQASSANLTEFTVPASATYGGNTLTDASIFALVKATIGKPDANAIYLVLTSSEIGESSGFLTKYCGWHTFGTISNTKVKYGFIGNPSSNLPVCGVQATSPNGNAGVDAMISIIAHELVETVSDPLLNAWYNSTKQENSDMCSWTFGSRVSVDSNGAYYNVTLPTRTGYRNYLLQRQLAAGTSKCYIDASSALQ